MELEITSVENNAATVRREYVEIIVLEYTNLKHYALVDNTYDDEIGLSNIHRHFYKFPDQEVFEDDKIYVYTGNGIDNNHKSRHGEHQVYHYYCGSDDFIWNNDGDVARILKISEVSRFDVPPVE